MQVRRYFAASCAHFAKELRNGFAAAGGSTSPVNAVLNVTMCPVKVMGAVFVLLHYSPVQADSAKTPRAREDQHLRPHLPIRISFRMTTNRTGRN